MTAPLRLACLHLACLGLAIPSLATGCGSESCGDSGASSFVAVGIEHFVDDGAWSYRLEAEGSTVLCSYLAPLDTVEVSCEGPGVPDVSVNGTVHTLHEIRLESAPDSIVFTAVHEGAEVHSETLSPGYQIHRGDEDCGGDWYSGTANVSW